jgi:uncharacterized membrane protein
MFNLLKVNLLYVKIGVAAVLGSLVFYSGSVYGSYKTSKAEIKKCESKQQELVKEFKEYKIQSNVTILELQKNADKWRVALYEAKANAIKSAKEQEKQNSDIRAVTNALTRRIENPITIIKETKNGCTLNDVIINTDASDGLRNCFSQGDPSKCVTSNSNN